MAGWRSLDKIFWNYKIHLFWEKKIQPFFSSLMKNFKIRTTVSYTREGMPVENICRKAEYSAPTGALQAPVHTEAESSWACARKKGRITIKSQNGLGWRRT